MNTGLISLVGYGGAISLGLCLLVGLLAGVLRITEGLRVTIRRWLAVAWVMSLVVPALTLLLDVAVVSMLRSALPSSAWSKLHGQIVFAALPVVVPIAAFVLTMALLAWMTGRVVLRPLADMRQAARQVASGDLDVILRAPQVYEVAEVANAFNAMGSALRASLEHQAELEQERRLFISAIAHDLRTPLFSLRGYLEGLDRGIADTPEKRARYIAVCREKADALEHLVADLFVYARMEYLADTPRAEPVELGALLASSLESVRPQAAAKDVRLALDGGGPACMASGDPHLLTRAVENLLDNAVRHSPYGGRVVVAWSSDEDQATFSVADSGPGFAAQDLPHLFEPLYRGDASRNAGTGGAGLGLAIARRIMRAHGGDLTAANHLQGGALLTATLPCGAAHDTHTVAPAAAAPDPLAQLAAPQMRVAAQ